MSPIAERRCRAASATPLAVLGLLAALLSGCESLDTEQGIPGTSFADNERALHAITHWEMRGRIAINTGAEARQARFTWWQEGDSLRLNIRGPLNAGAVEIRGNAEELTLRARRETRTLTDPENQLSDLLGWWLPVTSLPDWLLGLPDRRFASTGTVITAERLRSLRQRDWLLDYGDYAQFEAVAIPAGITLQHASLELVVTIDDWTDQSAANLELTRSGRAQ